MGDVVKSLFPGLLVLLIVLGFSGYLAGATFKGLRLRRSQQQERRRQRLKFWGFE